MSDLRLCTCEERGICLACRARAGWVNSNVKPLGPARYHSPPTYKIPVPKPKPNVCAQCGSEKTKLITCASCKGNVKLKVCPSCS